MKILVFGSEYQGRYIEELKRVMSCLSGSGADVVVDSEFHRYLRELHVVPEGFGVADIDGGALDADVALSFGGDGTFLRTARKVALRGVPIMGINTGSLGYLADVSIDDAEKAIGKCLTGEYCIDSRTMLHVSTSDVEIDFPYALNEVAIQKSLTAQMLKMRTTLNGVYLTTYMGDGLLVSTPTGSTAYNLSVGGPIIEPSSHSFAVAPIAAHSLTMRPIVLNDDCRIDITTLSRCDTYCVSLDGNNYTLPSGSTISLCRAPYEVKVVKVNGHNFASTLRSKLMWGVDAR